MLCDETQGNPEQFLRMALDSMPYAVPPLEVFADLLLAQNRESEAAPILIELDRLGSVKGTALLAILYIRHGRYHEGLPKWESVLAREPDNEVARAEVEKLRAVLFHAAPAVEA